jgi:PAS domain S-box-containing protein
MQILTDPTPARLTKPHLPDALRRVIGGSLRIQPKWQDGEDIHAIADAIRQSIVILAPDGETVYANRAALDHTGVTAREASSKGFLARAFHPDDVARVRKQRRMGLREGLPFELEMRSLFKNGQHRWQLVQYSPLKDAQGRIIRWYATATDIEDRRRTEELRLEERVKERTRIARELHDTLLGSFQGLLLKLSAVKCLIPDRPKEAEEQLDRMVEQARNAVTEGRDAVLGLRSSTVIANDLAQAITKFGAGLAGDGGSPEFSVRAEGRCGDLSPFVRDEVYRIASEALRNAFRHAGAGRIEVEIRYDNREFRLRVRDDGKGIDAKIFNAGMRAGHHGMPGMHERAKLAGGNLKFRSQLDSGTEIELTIPASLAYVNDLSAAPTVAPVRATAKTR